MAGEMDALIPPTEVAEAPPDAPVEDSAQAAEQPVEEGFEPDQEDMAAFDSLPPEAKAMAQAAVEARIRKMQTNIGHRRHKETEELRQLKQKTAQLEQWAPVVGLLESNPEYAMKFMQIVSGQTPQQQYQEPPKPQEPAYIAKAKQLGMSEEGISLLREMMQQELESTVKPLREQSEMQRADMELAQTLTKANGNLFDYEELLPDMQQMLRSDPMAQRIYNSIPSWRDKLSSLYFYAAQKKAPSLIKSQAQASAQSAANKQAASMVTGGAATSPATEKPKQDDLALMYQDMINKRRQ